MNATDKDTLDRSTLVYSLITDHSDQFHVDAATGKLTNVAETLRCPCDRSNVCECSLTVAVKDSGGLSDTAYVLVQLVDLNDNPPNIQIITLR